MDAEEKAKEEVILQTLNHPNSFIYNVDSAEPDQQIIPQADADSHTTIHPEKKDEDVKSLVHRFDNHSCGELKIKIDTYDAIKNIIQGRSVHARLMVVVAAGLPKSGTSTLLHYLLNQTKYSSTPRKLEVYPTALFVNSTTKESHLVGLEEHENQGMLLIAFMKLMMSEYYIEELPQVNPDILFFKECRDVNNYFKCFCQNFLKFRKMMNNKQIVPVMKDQNFINFLDVTVNKAIYEFLFIVGRQFKNIFLLCPLDLTHYNSNVLKESLDLSAEHFPTNYYHEDDIKALKVHSACHYYVLIFEGVFAQQKKERTLLVFTHKGDVSEEHVKDVLSQINVYAKKIKISTVSTDNYIQIDMPHGKSIECKPLRQKLVDLIEKSSKRGEDIELRYMFFYCYLKSTGKMYLTLETVLTLGSKCEMEKDDTLKCLQLLHDSCFLFFIKKKEEKKEKEKKDYVILNIKKFVDGFEKLYYIRSDETASVLLDDIDFGFLSESICHHIWDQPNNLYDLYVDILIEVGLMIILKGTSQFLMPSLRIGYEPPSEPSTEIPLLIISDMFIHFHQQCQFVNCFQNGTEEWAFKKAEVLKSSYYDVLKLKLDFAEVKIKFCGKLLEVSVTNFKQLLDEDRTKVYSLIKTTCAQILNEIRNKQQNEQMRYQFAVYCPKRMSGDLDHVIFQNSNESESYYCMSCKRVPEGDLMQEKDEKERWLAAACDVDTLHDDDKLTHGEIERITDMLANNYEVEEICKQFEDLCPENRDTAWKKSEGKDKLFYALDKWYLDKKSKFDIANILHKMGYSDTAFEVAPLMGTWSKPEDKIKPEKIESNGAKELAAAFASSSITYTCGKKEQKEISENKQLNNINNSY